MTVRVGGVRLVWDRAQIKALKTDPELVAYVKEVAEGMARRERELAPKRSGAGAASIQARPSRAQGAQDVGWDKEHYYMGYQELGTVHVERKNFAGQTLATYIHT